MPSFLLWIASPPWEEAWSLEQRDDALGMGWDGMGFPGRIFSPFCMGTLFFTPGYCWLLQKPVESKIFLTQGKKVGQFARLVAPTKDVLNVVMPKIINISSISA